MSQEGRGYSFSQGKPYSLGTVYWLFWKSPDKQRVEVTKQRDIVTINDGDEGYEVTYRGTALEDKEQLQTTIATGNTRWKMFCVSGSRNRASLSFMTEPLSPNRKQLTPSP